MAALFIKLALYVAALGAAGLAFAAATVLRSEGEREARGALRAAGLLAIAAAAAAALRFGRDAATLAGGWAHIAEPPYLSWTFEAQAPFLALLAVGVGLMGIAGVLGRRSLAAVGGLVLLASFTAAGHVSAAPPAVWLRLALWAHLIGVACWLTAPVLLWPARSRDDTTVLARTQAFSQLAMGIVPVALVAGLILAVVLLEKPVDAIATAYGRLIVVKAFAASAAFALGALNKVWVTRRLMDDPKKGRAALKATLAVDAVLFAIALIAVAGATTVFAPSH